MTPNFRVHLVPKVRASSQANASLRCAAAAAADPSSAAQGPASEAVPFLSRV